MHSLVISFISKPRHPRDIYLQLFPQHIFLAIHVKLRFVDYEKTAEVHEYTRASLLYTVNSNFIRRNSGKSSCLSITGDYTVTTLSLRANAISFLRREVSIVRGEEEARRFRASSIQFGNFSSNAAIKRESFPRILRRGNKKKGRKYSRLFYPRVRAKHSCE